MKRALAILLLGAGLVMSPLPASAEPDGTIEIEITEISAVHTPGESLPVTVQITNEGERLEDIPLHLTTQASVPSYRNNIMDWLEDDLENQMLTLDSRTVDVPSGVSTVKIEVPADVITWGNTTTSWGPRGIEATLDAGEETSDRTFLITEPSFAIEPMEFTTLVPVTVGAEDLSTVPTTAQRYEDTLTALSEGTISDGEELPDPVTEAVQSAADRAITQIDTLTSPGMTVALDSALAALEYGTYDRISESLEGFSGTGHELMLLPGLDADMAGWANTGDDRYFATHVEQMDRTTLALQNDDIISRSDVLYTPVAPSLTTVSHALEHGSELVILTDEQVSTSGELYWTPSARADVTVDGMTIPALITNTQLSELLSGAGTMSDLDRRQTLLALTAVHYRERPNDPRPIVMSMPRADDTAINLESLNELVTALDDAAWMEGSTLSDIADSPASSVAREDLDGETAEGTSITASELHTLTNSGNAIFGIGDLTTHPHVYRDAVEVTTDIVGSWALTALPGEISHRVLSLQALSVELANALKVQESSTINLISQASELPVHVTSTLPFPITLTVGVDSEDGRLRFTDVDTVVQPSTTTTVGVPVRAIGSGDVTIHVQIAGSQGQPIGDGTDIKIRVRADWENMGTAITAGVFVIILIIGIVRSARRGKRSEGVSEISTVREGPTHG